MKPPQALHEAGQSRWLDNITRALLEEGILARYVTEYSVTGLTSNPTIFDRAIRDGTAYDADIAARKATGASDEEVLFDLALADLRRAAGLFAPVHVRTDGGQRRIRAGLNPAVGSVASMFVSRWDAAIADRVPDELRNRLDIAVAKQAYRAYQELLVSARWARLANEGARAQRLLWASTSVKDPRARDVLYVEALAAPFTVNTTPDQTLEAFAASWQDLLARIGARHEQLARTA